MNFDFSKLIMFNHRWIFTEFYADLKLIQDVQSSIYREEYLNCAEQSFIVTALLCYKIYWLQEI